MDDPTSHSVRIARATRSLEGLSIGDAFGERFFGPADVMAARIAARTLSPPPWAYTDDTEMAIAIVEVLSVHGALDQNDLALAFARRYREQPDRGYGPTAHELLRVMGAGVPWRVATRVPFGGAGSMGNGGAMRVAPLGAYYVDDVAALVRAAAASAEVTHFHAEGQAGAVAVALAAAWAWQHRNRASREGDESLFAFVIAHTPEGETREVLRKAARLPLDSPIPKAARLLGSGNHMISSDTVPFALWCASRHLDDFEAAMWSTVAGLGDRDTTCAIVGGIVALTELGWASIPTSWRAAREPLPVLGTVFSKFRF